MIAAPIQTKQIRKSQQIHYDNQGFLYLPQLMSPDLTRRVRAAYDRAEQKHISPRRLAEGKAFYDVPFPLDEDPVFIELATLPDLLPYLFSTVGDDVQLIQACARLFPPGKTFTAPWHSDMANTLGIDLGHSKNFNIKVHFYFEDLKPNQGCLAFLPGSHHLPRELERPRPADIDIASDAVVIVPKAGDAVLFNTHCLHMALDNTSPDDRRTLIYGYSHFWVKQSPDAQPADLNQVPKGALEQQIFGIGTEGISTWDQRPWSEPKPSAISKLRQKVGRRLIGQP